MELAAAQKAADRYIHTPPDDVEPGFAISGKQHENGFAFDKALEALTLLPTTWPIVKELTNDKPQLSRGHAGRSRGREGS